MATRAALVLLVVAALPASGTSKTPQHILDRLRKLPLWPTGPWALHNAAKKGDAEAIDRLLDEAPAETPVIDAFDLDAMTPLILAVKEGHTDAVAALLRRGADPDKTDRPGNAPLHWGAKEGQAEAIQTLIDGGATVDYSGPLGSNTALIFAVLNQHLDSVRTLLSAGADPNVKVRRGRTALSAATAKNRGDLVSMLVEAGADVNMLSGIPGKMRTPLMIAAELGAAYAADSLLRGGSHLNIRNSMGDTALDVARQFMAAPPPGGSYELHAEIIQMLNALEEEYTRAKQRKQKKQKKTTTTEKEL